MDKELNFMQSCIKSDLLKVNEGDKIPYRFSELFSHYLQLHSLLTLYSTVNLIDHSLVLSLEKELDTVLGQLRDNIKAELLSN